MSLKDIIEGLDDKKRESLLYELVNLLVLFKDDKDKYDKLKEIGKFLDSNLLYDIITSFNDVNQKIKCLKEFPLDDADKRLALGAISHDLNINNSKDVCEIIATMKSDTLRLQTINLLSEKNKIKDEYKIIVVKSMKSDDYKIGCIKQGYVKKTEDKIGVILSLRDENLLKAIDKIDLVTVKAELITRMRRETLLKASDEQLKEFKEILTSVNKNGFIMDGDKMLRVEENLSYEVRATSIDAILKTRANKNSGR